MNDVCMSAAFASFTSNITVYEVQVRMEVQVADNVCTGSQQYEPVHTQTANNTST